jgi:hypothetical protein
MTSRRDFKCKIVKIYKNPDELEVNHVGRITSHSRQ